MRLSEFLCSKLRLMSSFVAMLCLVGCGRDAGLSSVRQPQSVFCAELDRYEVVRDAELSAVDRFVLDDMKSLLARALGHELREVGNDQPQHDGMTGRLYFGIAPEGFDRAGLSPEERCVVLTNGFIYVFGNGVNGNRYAAYDFLQNTLGFKFYDARGGIGVPDLTCLSLTNGIRRSTFAFPLRQISSRCRYNGREAALFLFRHGINDSYSVELMKAEGLPVSIEPAFRTPWPSDAGMPCYLPPNPQARRSVSRRVSARCGELEKTHPEYFTLSEKGVRVFDHQRCLSNRGCRDLIIRNFLDHVNGFKLPTVFDFSANDTGGRFCWCAACRCLEDVYGSPGGPLFDTIFELSEKVAERHPEHAVQMLAYRKDQTQHPPTNDMKFASNVIVQFAPIDDNFARDWRDPSNVESYEDLKRWCRLADRIWVWYYPNPYSPPSEAVPPPIGNLDRVAADIRMMKAAGVTGVHFEHNVGVATMTGFTELQSYVMLRMLDDVTLDEHQLAKDFLEFEYGPVAKDVADYHSSLECLRKGLTKPMRWSLPYSDYGYLTMDRLFRWEALFDEMEAKTSGLPEISSRLRRLRLGLDVVYLSELTAASEKDRSCVSRRLPVKARIVKTVDEIGQACYSDKHQAVYREFRDKVGERIFLDDVRSESQAKPLPPDIFGGIPSANLFVTIPKVNKRPYVEDADAAFGKAAVVDDLTKIPFPVKTGLDRPGEGGDLPGIGQINKQQIGLRGRYAFYEVGMATLTKKAILYVGSWLAFRANVGLAYEEGAFNKARFYASLKFEGPAFYKEDANLPNRVYCDRIVVVRDWKE